MESIGAKALEEFADSIKAWKAPFLASSDQTSVFSFPALHGLASTCFQNDPDKEYNMPKDGTVHELTSNVSHMKPLSRGLAVLRSAWTSCLIPWLLPQAILFLQQLLDFHETAGAMLASQGTPRVSTIAS